MNKDSTIDISEVTIRFNSVKEFDFVKDIVEVLEENSVCSNCGSNLKVKSDYRDLEKDKHECHVNLFCETCGNDEAEITLKGAIDG